MFWLVQLLVPIGVAVVLPIAVVAIVFKSALASERNRKEIVLAALEKNPDIDVELLMKNLKKSEKLIKEKLLARLEHGCLCCLMGVALRAALFLPQRAEGNSHHCWHSTDSHRHRLPRELLRRSPYAREGDGGRGAEHEQRIKTVYDERTIHSTGEERAGGVARLSARPLLR